MLRVVLHFKLQIERSAIYKWGKWHATIRMKTCGFIVMQGDGCIICISNFMLEFITIGDKFHFNGFSRRCLFVCTACVSGKLSRGHASRNENLHSPLEWHSSRIYWTRCGYTEQALSARINRFATPRAHFAVANSIILQLQRSPSDSRKILPVSSDRRLHHLSDDFLEKSKIHAKITILQLTTFEALSTTKILV